MTLYIIKAFFLLNTVGINSEYSIFRLDGNLEYNWGNDEMKQR
jgi:hypothetical protein